MENQLTEHLCLLIADDEFFEHSSKSLYHNRYILVCACFESFESCPKSKKQRKLKMIRFKELPNQFFLDSTTHELF